MRKNNAGRIIPSYKQGWAVHGESADPDGWNGVIGAWAPYLGATGATIPGHSAHKQHGTLIGADWTPNGLSFGGGTDRVVIPHNDIFSFAVTDPFSISIWYNRAVPVSVQLLLSKQETVNFDGWAVGFNFEAGQTDKYLFYFGKNAASANLSVKSNLSFTDTNEWHKIDYDYDGSVTAAGVRMYRDGREIETAVIFDALVANPDNVADIMIGARLTDLGFSGLIDEAIVFNQSRSPVEIFESYLNTYAMYEKVISPGVFGMAEGLQLPVFYNILNRRRTG